MDNIKVSNTIPIFVLTMDNPGGVRWVHCEKEFSNLGLDFNFVEGFKVDNPEITRIFSFIKNFFLVKRKLTHEEISCYLGHRKIWRQFLNSDKDVCLITEDDVMIRDIEAFKRVISFANDNDNWDILKLFDYKPKPIKNSQAWNGLSIVDYQFPASGTVAYLTTRYAANQLLSRKKIYRAIDDGWSNCWELGIKIRSLYPNIAEEVSNILDGSLIEESRSRNKEGKKIIRSLWGMILQVIKQIRSKIYIRNLKESKNDT